MGTPLIGMNAILGLAEEVTYGTPVTPDHWLPILRHSIQGSADIRPVPYLGVANNEAYHTERDSVLLSSSVGGDVETCACYDSTAFLLLLKHAMGAVTTTHPATPYIHTFSLDTDGVVGLTGRTVQGSQITDRAENWNGLVVNQLVLSVDAGGWMGAVASLIGRASGGPVTLSGTPAFAAAEEVLSHQGSTFAWNGHTPTLRSLKLTINNNLIRRPFIGSLFTDRPAPGGFASVMVEATFPWEDNDLYTDFRANTSANGVVAFTGTGNNSLTLSLNNLKILSVERAVASAGELVQRITAKCFDLPGTNQALGIVVHNDNATAI